MFETIVHFSRLVLDPKTDLHYPNIPDYFCVIFEKDTLSIIDIRSWAFKMFTIIFEFHQPKDSILNLYNFFPDTLLVHRNTTDFCALIMYLQLY